ncbi:hypothetical protein U0070_004812 [Myodes glareolus]|uniref:AIG1-type G domain-containing protein n=1 Tax=Myodes glareolus TaxID=447135 RepID=A0AAW0J5N9_MYOGA
MDRLHKGAESIGSYNAETFFWPFCSIYKRYCISAPPGEPEISWACNATGDRKQSHSCLSASPNGEWDGKEVEVTDTLDILSPQYQPEVAAEKICEVFASPGPHVVLLVIQVGRYTAEDQQAARRLQEIFGEGILAYTILVFTRKKDLAGGSLEEYVQENNNKSLEDLHVACERRLSGLSNRAQGDERKAQMEDLKEKIELVLWENEGHCSTTKLPNVPSKAV